MAQKRTPSMKEKCSNFPKISRTLYQKNSLKKEGWTEVFAGYQMHLHFLQATVTTTPPGIRLTVMYSLLSQPLCVCVIKEVVKIADSKLSYHLSILKNRISLSVNSRGTGLFTPSPITGARR